MFRLDSKYYNSAFSVGRTPLGKGTLLLCFLARLTIDPRTTPVKGGGHRTHIDKAQYLPATTNELRLKSCGKNTRPSGALGF